MELDNPVSELRRDIDRLEDAYLSLTKAMMMMNQALAEVYQHNAEHHEVLNGHARILETLESLMIGGENETPDPPAVS